jgi:glycosyltransferase involved in cell wall biosynthesis
MLSVLPVCRPLKVAIVSDTLVQAGGAERVVEVLAEAFPDAPIFTLLYDPMRGPGSIRERVVQSWLRRVPGSIRFPKALLPLYPSAIESFDLADFDVIVSSHHTLAKGILRNADQVHVCYCHTPMRSLWERPHREIERAPRPLRPLVRMILGRLRSWDLDAASHVDLFIANSAVTAERIAKHYRRRSRVVPPPIDTDRFVPGGPVGDYYLVACRNVPYKRIDLAIEAAEQLGRRLIVVGDGTDSLARPSEHVSYYGRVTDARLVALMRGAMALLFPQSEDFGMTVLEMNACGRPVIAYAKGGALETVIDGKTGVLFPEQTVENLILAIQEFEQLSFDAAAIRQHAEAFSKRRFLDAISRIVYDAVRKSSAGSEIVEHHFRASTAKAVS